MKIIKLTQGMLRCLIAEEMSRVSHKNALFGIVPNDGDIFELTLDEVAAIDHNAAMAAEQYGLHNFWATYPSDPDAPSLVMNGVAWDLMATESADDDPPWMWEDNAWIDISRY